MPPGVVGELLRGPSSVAGRLGDHLRFHLVERGEEELGLKLVALLHRDAAADEVGGGLDRLPDLVDAARAHGDRRLATEAELGEVGAVAGVGGDPGRRQRPLVGAEAASLEKRLDNLGLGVDLRLQLLQVVGAGAENDRPDRQIGLDDSLRESTDGDESIARPRLLEAAADEEAAAEHSQCEESRGNPAAGRRGHAAFLR